MATVMVRVAAGLMPRGRSVGRRRAMAPASMRTPSVLAAPATHRTFLTVERITAQVEAACLAAAPIRIVTLDLDIGAGAGRVPI